MACLNRDYVVSRSKFNLNPLLKHMRRAFYGTFRIIYLFIKMITLLSILTSCVVIILTCMLLIRRYSRAGRLMAKIPGPRGLPLFGNILTIQQSPEKLFRSLRKWHKTYGRIYQLSGLHVRTIHISHPQDLEVILSSTRHIRKQMPYTFLYNWLRNGLLISNGDIWHQRRKMLTPAFHLNILKKFIQTFNEQTESLLWSLEKEMENKRTDIIPPITKVALSIMCETSLGTKIHQDSPAMENYIKCVRKIGECTVKWLTSPWYFVDFTYKLSSLSQTEKSVLPKLHKFTKEMIEERREHRQIQSTDTCVNDEENEESAKMSMLDLLLDQEENHKIDDDGIREEVDTFVFEGHDTTATALIFMIFRIANEPEIQDNIYAELERIFGDSQRQCSLSDLSKMKYLDCCIKESLRLYCSVPFISRHLTEEVVIAGYKIPKNTSCDIHIFDLHHNPEIYPDPEKFIPERFLPENMVKLHPYAYIPFSAGSRNCIGQKYAFMEMKTVMCGLLRKYKLEPVTKLEDLVFSCDLVLRTNHPIYVCFTKRIPLNGDQ